MRKIGFWSIISIVIGSQIGSGVFVLPSQMANFGYFGVLAILAASFGALSLAYIFARLCAIFPKTGGPHVYVQNILGNDLAIFTGWTYWVVSWVSSLAVVVVAIKSLVPIIGDNQNLILFLEIGLLGIITYINSKGVTASSKAEMVLSFIKVVPLLILPLIALKDFKVEHFLEPSFEINFFQIVILGLWGFIGVETATTPASNVVNPSRNIPLAILLGTAIVSIVYIVNTVGIVGIIPPSELIHIQSPYAKVAGVIFGGNWEILMALLVSVICIGTLNAWVLASGQIALGCSKDNLMPKFIGKTNEHDAPVVALVISFLCSVPLLYLMQQHSFNAQIFYLIEVSVIVFLYTYLICAFAYFIYALREKLSIAQILISLVAMSFCLLVISHSGASVLISSILFMLSALPIYLWLKFT